MKNENKLFAGILAVLIMCAGIIAAIPYVSQQYEAYRQEQENKYWADAFHQTLGSSEVTVNGVTYYY